MRSMGLDIGDKRIGVALSDPGGILASPLTIIERSELRQELDAIADIVKQQEVGRVIIGLPRSMDGTTGSQVQKVQDFVQELCRCIDVPVEFRDERLTTVSARRLMKSGRKKSHKKERYDAAAAAIILQSYLEEGR
jgi:putative Holliday junction resolvase